MKKSKAIGYKDFTGKTSVSSKQAHRVATVEDFRTEKGTFKLDTPYYVEVGVNKSLIVGAFRTNPVMDKDDFKSMISKKLIWIKN